MWYVCVSLCLCGVCVSLSLCGVCISLSVWCVYLSLCVVCVSLFLSLCVVCVGLMHVSPCLYMCVRMCIVLVSATIHVCTRYIPEVETETDQPSHILIMPSHAVAFKLVY